MQQGRLEACGEVTGAGVIGSVAVSPQRSESGELGAVGSCVYFLLPSCYAGIKARTLCMLRTCCPTELRSSTSLLEACPE